MLEPAKEDREIIYSLLQELDFERRRKEQLTELMRVIGFEDDVPYVQSLFTNRIVQIYASNKGKYQIFLANDQVAKLSTQIRQLLFALFRMYHQKKLKQQMKNETIKDHDDIKLPDPKNINQVIKFQKQMFFMFRNIIPQAGTNMSQALHHQEPKIGKISPFPIFYDQRFRHADNDFSYFNSPLITGQQSHSYSNSFYDEFKYRNANQINHNNLFNERQSAFKKGGEFDKSISGNTGYFGGNLSEKGFQPIYNSYEGQYPSKKQKIDLQTFIVSEQINNITQKSQNLKANANSHLINDSLIQKSQIQKLSQSNLQSITKQAFEMPIEFTNSKNSNKQQR